VLVHALAVVLDARLERRRLRLGIERVVPRIRRRLVLDLALDHLKLVPREREVVPAPRPWQDALAAVRGLVVVARGARRRRHDRAGLQPVRQDDVRVHRRDVKVVDERLLLAQRVVAQQLQLLDDRVAHGVVVHDLAALDAVLDLEREREAQVDLVDQGLERGGHELELRGDVRAEDARLEALHVPPDVRLRLQPVPLKEPLRRVHLLVRAHDVPAERLHHEEALAQRARALPQHVLGAHRDDRAEREDKVVDVLAVQVVRRDRVGHGVRRHVPRLLVREPQHVLGVNFWNTHTHAHTHAVITPRLRARTTRAGRCTPAPTGSYSSLYFVTLLRPCEPCGR
jgi:hypothetical protein